MDTDPFPPSLFGKKAVSVNVGIILVLAAFIVGAALVYCHQTYPDLRESIKFGSALFVAGLTVAGILITAENLRRSVLERRSLAAARFMERFNDPKYFDMKLTWKLVYTEINKRSGKEVIDYIEAETQSPMATGTQETARLQTTFLRRHTTVQYFNFFEELAIAIHTKAADEDLLKRFFRTIVLNSYSAARPWVEWMRQQQGSHRTYIEVELLANEWRT